MIPEGFVDYYSAIHEQVDFYYIETREKHTSHLVEKKPDMSVSQNARDIQAALDALGLSRLDDFVLSATCWASASLLQGLLDGTLEAPTIVAVDPMHTLWFPKWVLRYLSPIIPLWSVNFLKPVFRQALVGNMQEKVQKERIFACIEAADNRKWKRSAEAAVDFELFGRLSKIDREVFVFNGSSDKVHENFNYPRIAAEMPKARFIHIPGHESDRERGMGTICLEFAKVDKKQGMPDTLAPFELPLQGQAGVTR
jgi:hypothetical protein